MVAEKKIGKIKKNVMYFVSVTVPNQTMEADGREGGSGRIGRRRSLPLSARHSGDII